MGAKFYFTGKPCPHGHVCERYASGGDRGKCLFCARKRRNAFGRRYYRKNKEKFANYSAASYQRNKDKRNRESTEWRKANPERSRAIMAKWREANRELFRKICREWARNNKDKRHAHRAMRNGAEGSFTSDDVTEIMLKQKGRCAIPTCRIKLGNDFHIDHIVPLKLGGTNWRRNIQLLCPLCNARKGARDPIEHAQSLGLLL